MFKSNWMDLTPRLAFWDTCYVRDIFRRRDRLEERGGYKITQYLEWVSAHTVPAGKQLMYHKHNMEEIMYFLQGEGVISSGGSTHKVGVEDAAYVPTGAPHSIRSTIDNQPITFVSYTLPTPPDAKEVSIKKTSQKEKGGVVQVRRWTARECRPGHHGTCWTYGVFEKKDMLNFLFAVMMTVPGTLGYHRHNTEAIYFVRSGKGMMKVGGEELEIRAGDAVYIPFEVAHRPRTTVEDQPLNVFCVGVAIPYDAKVWTLEDLPDL